MIPSMIIPFCKKEHSQFRVSNVLRNLRVTKSYKSCVANAYETKRWKDSAFIRSVVQHVLLFFSPGEKQTRWKIFTRVADRKQTDKIIRMTSIGGGRKCDCVSTLQFCLFRFVCPTTRYLQFPDPISSLILISNARLKWYRDIEHRRYNCNV